MDREILMDPMGAGAPQASADVPGNVNASSPQDLPDVISGSNPLTAAANPLLNLIPQLRATVQHPDPARLRDFMIEQIRAFELRARAAGISSEVIIGARYCLCTALDETAALTPWGGTGIWAKHSLLVTFHNEVWGGEKFFQLLGKLAQNPQQHANLLELMYYCLALGFEGRFRIVDNGRTQLDTLKVRLADIIRQNRGSYEQPLALHWRGVTPGPRRAWEMLPLWVAAALMALIALGVYWWFSASLRLPSTRVATAISSIQTPKLREPAPPASPPVAQPRLQLPPEDERLARIQADPDRDIAILQGDGLFDPGSVKIKDGFVQVLTHLGGAINKVPGRVTVMGYTDDTPTRGTRFRNNQELSQARAESVKQFLATYVTDSARIRAIGAGAANFVDDNGTALGRARNRRVEITVDVPPVTSAAPPVSEQRR
ncbi:MAG: DotU family type VI secretion system protein [Pseudomonadota bacterium]|nr:DotU family type VI secretion system protein [Pseudomonadota bacterium]